MINLTNAIQIIGYKTIYFISNYLKLDDRNVKELKETRTQIQVNQLSTSVIFKVIKSSVVFGWFTPLFYKNIFLRTRASDFFKIKNKLRTTEPRIS